MADLTYAYAADITKAERDENGDLIVHGKAAGPDLDGDDQICDPEWLKKAMPGWATFSNIREMHAPICAGVGLESTEQGDDWWVRSKVIDDRTAKKIEAGGLKGYSVGIKNPRVVRDAKAPGGRIVGGNIVEISYVDRPCNPTAKLMMCKAAGINEPLQPVEAEDAEAALAKTEEPGEQPTGDGQATEPAPQAGDPVAHTAGDSTVSYTVKIDGGLDQDAIVKQIVAHLRKGSMPPLKEGGPERFPIKTVQDLKDAIQSFGRGKDSDKDEIKAHIKAEAKRLGRTDLIPDNWKALFADTTKAADGEPTHNPDELKAILTGLVNCMKAELDELLAGEDELFDVRCLLETVSGFCRWWFREAMGGETDSPFGDGESTPAYVGLGASPDATKSVETNGAGAVDNDKADTGTTEPDDTKTTTPDADKAVEGEETAEPSGSEHLAELVKSAVADALKGPEERMKALEADLQKALALPEPGGPVITRSADQSMAAKVSDVDRMRRDAETLLTKAAEVDVRDPRLASGYRTRARDLLDKATA